MQVIVGVDVGVRVGRGVNVALGVGVSVMVGVAVAVGSVTPVPVQLMVASVVTVVMYERMSNIVVPKIESCASVVI